MRIDVALILGEARAVAGAAASLSTEDCVVAQSKFATWSRDGAAGHWDKKAELESYSCWNVDNVQ